MLNMRPNDPHSAEDRARTMVAVVLSLAILLAYYVFYAKPHAEALRQAEQQKQEQQAAVSGKAPPAQPALEKPAVTREVALKETARLPVEGSRIEGSISLKGDRFDDIRLKDYYQDLSHKEKVALLTPADADRGYYIDNGWLSSSGGNLPDKDTVWTLSPSGAQKVESGGKPAILTWDNGHGLKFETDISLDANYLFTVKQRVTNNGTQPVSLNPYHTTSRESLPIDYRGFYALHEGPVAFLGDKTVDPQYKSLASSPPTEISDTTGWIGITDRYWLVAMLPQPDQHFNATIKGSNFGKPGQHYQADIVDATMAVKPGETKDETSYIYTGAKELKQIQDYQDHYHFKNFELTFDFGIYYLITKPFYYLLRFLIDISGKVTSSGQVGLGMLLMTLVVRGGMFPVASKSFRSMAKMRIVGPRMKELQEKYKDDKVKLQEEVFQLYKQYDVNPFSGCVPVFIQIPVFFALYKVILLSIELRQAPFWGWIPDLSSPDPTSIFNLFGLLPFAPPFTLTLGAWPCIYCLTMILQKRISPPLPDPAQERMQAYFPYFFSLMMSGFPSGLVIYYSWSNLLGVFQQYYILKQVGGQDTSLIRGHAERRKKGKKDDDSLPPAANDSDTTMGDSDIKPPPG
jgi:YidC/Oxa1 family membrane protein insertase